MAGEYRLSRKRLDFRPDAILTAAMLEELDNFPHEILALFYQDYCDGIVTGLNFREENGQIFLTPGLVRFQGGFYSLTQKLDLSAYIADCLKERPSSGKRWHIVLREGRSQTANGVPVEFLDLDCSAEAGEGSDSLEIASFTAGLKTVLPRIEGTGIVHSFLSTASLYLLDTPIADTGEPAFAPYIFLAARNALVAKERKSAPDFSLLFSLTQRPHLSMRTVRAYIQAMGGAAPESRSGIFSEFFRCLDIEAAEATAARKEDRKQAAGQEARKSILL